MATRRDRKDCRKLSLKLRTWNRSNNSPEQCWELLANNVASVWTGLKVWPVSNFARQLPTTRNRVCKQTQRVTSNIVGICWPTMLRLFARRRTPLVRFREESTFQRVIEKRRLKNSRDQLQNVSGHVMVSDERERELTVTVRFMWFGGWLDCLRYRGFQTLMVLFVGFHTVHT